MPTPRSTRYDTLDAWRGLACVAVLLFHAVAAGVASPAFVERVASAGGSVADWVVVGCVRLWVGVPVFFVISGYCIAAAAESARRRPRSARSFFVRRFRRIYPPLWAFLLLMAGAVAVLKPFGWDIPYHHPADVPAWQWAGSLTLTEEWRPHVFGPPRDYFVGHIWTLCYEEQFYLVVGLALLVAPTRLREVLAGVTAVVLLKVVGALSLPFPTDGLFLDGLWLAFAAGVGVYHRATAPKVAKWVLDAFLVLGTLWAFAHISDWRSFPQTIPANLLVAFPTALLLGWLHGWDSASAKWRLLAPLQWCGVRCYSLYLVHGPITIILSWSLFRSGVNDAIGTLLVTVPLCAAASLGAAWAFHRWVERRFLNAPTLLPPPLIEGRSVAQQPGGEPSQTQSESPHPPLHSDLPSTRGGGKEDAVPVQAAASGASATVTSRVLCPVES